jgi:hypothetical protein
VASSEERQQQRADWRRAVSAKAAADRNARQYRRGPTSTIGPGMLRRSVSQLNDTGADLFADDKRLPRCSFPGCPVRYRGGPDRPCPQHQDDSGVHQAAAELGIDLGAMTETVPDKRDDGSQTRS